MLSFEMKIAYDIWIRQMASKPFIPAFSVIQRYFSTEGFLSTTPSTPQFLPRLPFIDCCILFTGILCCIFAGTPTRRLLCLCVHHHCPTAIYSPSVRLLGPNHLICELRVFNRWDLRLLTSTSALILYVFIPGCCEDVLY